MVVWERADVLALAPDVSSRSAAASLSGPASWSATGRTDGAVWGLCQGSGSRPYQTTVALESPPAYACSCPSRKHPCKHVLALLLRWAAGGVAPGDPPAFAAEWLAGRAARASVAAETAATRERSPDPETAAQRAAARSARVAVGLDDLDRWLRDQVATGIATFPRAGYAHFDQVAARLVDAQAPGVAGVLRSLPSELTGDGWPTRALERLAALRLLVAAHRRLDALPEDLAATVRSRIGFPVAKETVSARPGVADVWLALGSVDTVELRLDTRRVWLWGSGSRRWGQWLTFAPSGQGLDESVRVGQAYAVDGHFYPGAGQYRMLLGAELEDTGPAVTPSLPLGGSLGDARRQLADLLAVDPWADRMPVVIHGRVDPPRQAGEPWWVVDLDGRRRPLVTGLEEPWPLLAHTTEAPAHIFGEWSSTAFRPLSVLPDGLGRVLTAEVFG